MLRLCTICVRGGSKGVKNKNLKFFLGQPLIYQTIRMAQDSNLFDTIAVSSDSDEILNYVEECGVDVVIKRPVDLAQDNSGKIPAIKHAVREVEKKRERSFDIVCDLDATSPLRTIEDIQLAVKQLEEASIGNLLSAMPARRSPYFNLLEVTKDGVAHLSKELPVAILRRQDSPKCYDANASIYVWKKEVLLSNDVLFLEDTALYIMPEERSLDIDTPMDFEVVEFLASKREDMYR
jgi:CMP-N,N'-diacetyllegionaminic acid synthase